MVETDTSVCCRVVNEPMRKISTNSAGQLVHTVAIKDICSGGNSFCVSKTLNSTLQQSKWLSRIAKPFPGPQSPVRYSMICLKKHFSGADVGGKQRLGPQPWGSYFGLYHPALPMSCRERREKVELHLLLMQRWKKKERNQIRWGCREERMRKIANI